MQGGHILLREAMDMFRTRHTGRLCDKARMIGFLLMLTGLILMMVIVPGWAWAGLLCAALILAGFLIWYCG